MVRVHSNGQTKLMCIVVNGSSERCRAREPLQQAAAPSTQVNSTQGTFEWPDKAHVYRGQWQFGEMSGKGTLTTSCGSIYSGEFHAGNMEGRGTITFISNDQYVGVFKDSMFNGLGTYTWSAGTSIVGVFENNMCSKVGKKTLPGGQVYVGEMKHDLEDGKGVFTDGDQRIIGIWKDGALLEQLFETIVPLWRSMTILPQHSM